MSLPLTRMASFALVVKHKSFTGAAKALGVPRSTVSQQVSALEEQLDVKLLLRSTRSLSLTTAGEVYYKHCNRMLIAAEDANFALNDWRDHPTGKLRITAPEASGIIIHGPLLARFQQRYPSIEVELLVTDDKLDVIKQGIDVAFRTGPLPDSTMVCRKLSKIDRCVVASPQYLVDLPEPTVNTLRDYECLGHFSLTHWPLLNQSRVEKIEVPVKFNCNSLMALREACMAGRGLAMLPTFVCRTQIEAGELTVLTGLKAPDNDYYMLYPDRKKQSKALKCYLDFIRSDFPNRLY